MQAYKNERYSVRRRKRYAIDCIDMMYNKNERYSVRRRKLSLWQGYKHAGQLLIRMNDTP